MNKSLIAAALQARHNAVATYSGYQVGAAVLAQDGTVILGCNVESEINSLSSCAERSAILAALAQGFRNFTAIAVATEDGGTCCGSCRQFIMEFCGDIPIYISDTKNNVQTYTATDLLPHAFSLDPRFSKK